MADQLMGDNPALFKAMYGVDIKNRAKHTWGEIDTSKEKQIM